MTPFRNKFSKEISLLFGANLFLFRPNLLKNLTLIRNIYSIEFWLRFGPKFLRNLCLNRSKLSREIWLRLGVNFLMKIDSDSNEIWGKFLHKFDSHTNQSFYRICLRFGANFQEKFDSVWEQIFWWYLTANRNKFLTKF